MMENQDKDIGTRILEDNRGEWELIKIGLDAHNITNYLFFDRSADLLKDILEDTKVVILDYQLSEGDNGYDVMLKAKVKCPDCYFIIVTGFDLSQKIMADFINAGADWFVEKFGSMKYVDRVVEAVRVGKLKVEKRMIVTEAMKRSGESILLRIQRIDEIVAKIQNIGNVRGFG